MVSHTPRWHDPPGNDWRYQVPGEEWMSEVLITEERRMKELLPGEGRMKMLLPGEE